MKKINYTLLIAIIIITLLGLLMIYSSSYVWAEYKFNDPYKFLKTQGFFLIIGYIIIIMKILYIVSSAKIFKNGITSTLI